MPAPAPPSLTDLDALRAEVDRLQRGGLPSHAALRSVHAWHLDAYEGSGVRSVRVSTRCCPTCDLEEGRVLTVAEAREVQPLPCPECTRDAGAHGEGRCACRYLPW